MKRIKMNSWQLVVACLILFTGLLSACGSQVNYKKVRQEVLDKHDELMIDTESAMRNKMKLDTLLGSLADLKKSQPALDTAMERQNIVSIQALLEQADESMMDWMQDFEAEIGKKSNDEAVAYFNSEMNKLKTMDSLFKKALSGSDEYLKRFNPNHKPASHEGHGHAH